MKILFLCGREVNYTRNQVLLNALKRIGTVDVVAEQGKSGSIVFRSLWVVLQAIPRVLSRKYDLVFIGFYGHFITLLLGHLINCPLLFDAFISTYDTLINDRRIAKEDSFFAKVAYWIDKKACLLSDFILLDTQQHIEYFTNVFKLEASSFKSVPVGCDEEIFFPRSEKNITSSEKNITSSVTVLYYCTYLPLHGTEFVIEAASKLKSKNIKFRIVGNGKEYSKMVLLAKSLGTTNITFLPSLPLQTLAEEIAGADICLGGHFGTSEKSGRVIAGKTYQCLAMGKPTIVGENQANQEMLTHAYDSWLCKMGDANALAEAIQFLAEDVPLRQKIGCKGRQTYLEKSSIKVINHQVYEIVNKILAYHRRAR